MLADRLKVRDGGDRGYDVLDGGVTIGTFPGIVEAARFVRDQGARLWLDWDRTVIAGQTRPRDFTPHFLGSGVGRILGEFYGVGAGTWNWSISTHDSRWRKHGGQRGTEPSKDEAVVRLEREFTNYLADTVDKPSSYAQAKGV